MKTAILQCLQQFSSKNSKNVYHDQFLKKVKLQCLCSKNVYDDFAQFLKKVKLQCLCKIVQNVRFSL